MALADANIRAVITAKDEASAVLDKFGGKVGKVAEVAGEALLVAGAAAAGFATLSVKAYAESEAIGAQLNSVLQTTGKSAQISTKQVEALAMQMENYSGKSHDAIEQGQILLLQFSQTTSKNLPEMTKAMLNISQRMGVDTVMAAKTLGIALDDPTTGMSRLRRAGVDFTESQKEAIKALQKSGDVAGADALLMKALDEKMGTAAHTYRETFAGSVSAAKNSLKDFEIVVGSTISQHLEPLAKKLADVLSKIDWQKVVDTSIATLKRWWGELDKAWQSIDKVYQAIEKYLEPKIVALENTLKSIWPTIKTFADTYLIPLAKVIGTVAGEGLVGAIGLSIDMWNALIKAAKPVLDWMDSHKIIVEALAGAFTVLAGAMALQAAFDAIRVAAATFELVTIPGMMTSLSNYIALATGPIAMGAIAVAGALADIGLVYEAVQSVLGAISAMNGYKDEVRGVASSDSTLKPELEKTLKNPSASAKEKTSAQAALDRIKMEQAKANAMNAGGTNFFASGGLSLVGEQGPELVTLPRGSAVTPHNKMGGIGGQINITVQAGAFMGNPQDARQYAKLILSSLQDVASAQGMNLDQLWRHNGVRSI